MKTLLIILLMVFPLGSLCAQGGAAARAATEIGEAILRRGGTEAAGELAQLGGRKAVQEILEQAAREGGEALVKKTAQLAETHGLLAIKALQGAPGAVVKAMDALPGEFAEQGLRAIVREPAVMHGMIREFGGAALETAARHPGLAGKISAGLGREGLEMAAGLTTPGATALARFSDDIARLPLPERASVMSLLRQSPGRVLAWLERHPKILVAGSVTAGVVAARREIFGEGKDPGFLERLGGRFYRTFRTPLHLIVAVLTGVVLLWAAVKMRRIVRAGRRSG